MSNFLGVSEAFTADNRGKCSLSKGTGKGQATMDDLQIAGGPPLYIITIAPGDDHTFTASLMQQNIPIAGVAPEPPAADLPDALLELAESLPYIDPDDDIPFFPNVTFLITVHRNDVGQLQTTLAAAGPMVGHQIPLPAGMAQFIRILAEQLQNRINGSVAT